MLASGWWVACTHTHTKKDGAKLANLKRCSSFSFGSVSFPTHPPDRTFQNSRAAKPGDRRFLFSAERLIDGF